MSLFGSLGLAKVPYLDWLFPVLLGFLGLHLYLLYRKIDTHGARPFQLSLLGAGLLLLGRLVFDEASWLVFSGVAALVAASLLLNFKTYSLTKQIAK